MHEHQCFINNANTILTFQGHPEKDAKTALLRLNDAKRWYGIDVGDAALRERVQKRIELPHDGDVIWRRVVEWALEK